MKIKSYNAIMYHILARFYSTDEFNVLADKIDDLFNNTTIDGCTISGRLVPCRFINSSLFTNSSVFEKYDIRKLYSYECQFDIIFHKDYDISCAKFCVNYIKPYLDKIDSIINYISFSDFN